MIAVIAAIVFIAGLWVHRKTGNLAAVMFYSFLSSHLNRFTHRFGQVLNNIYPGTYLFSACNLCFYSWFNIECKVSDLLEKHQQLTAVLKHYDLYAQELLINVFLETEKVEIEMILNKPEIDLQILNIQKTEN